MAPVLAILGFLLVIGIIRSQAALILFVCLLGIAVLLSAAWSRRSTHRLSYRRSFDPPRVFPGEATEYVVELTNRKRLPLPWAEIDERMPAALLPSQDQKETAGSPWQRRRTVSLGWYERLELRQTFSSTERGEYVVGPTEVETGDPLGIFPVRLEVPESRCLVVYPRIAELDWAALQSRFPFGPIKARPPVLEDPSWFAGIRDYRPGDPRRWVDWKATARRLQLQTRVFTPTTLTNLVVALNVQTMPHAWQGYDPARLEGAIGVAAALVRNWLAAQCAVGLAANASGGSIETFQAYLPPSRRPTQTAEVLSLLARLSPIPTLAFGAFLRQVAANLTYGAGLVAVAASFDQESADSLCTLAEHGHAVSLFYLGAELPCDLLRDIPVVLLPEVTFEPIAASSMTPSSSAIL